MTVYVTQELKGRDLSGALSFGELEVLVRANWAVTDESVNEIITDIYDSLDSFNLQRNYRCAYNCRQPELRSYCS